MNKYNGSCLCGEVVYTFDGEVNDYGYCHCSKCRKASGSAYSANAEVALENFKINDPKNYLTEYESTKGTHRFFCSNCGSPIYTLKDKTPNLVRVRLGTLDTDFDKKASRHTFVADKANWYEITDDSPQFEGRFEE